MDVEQYDRLYKLLDRYVDELQGYDPTRTDFEHVLRHIKHVRDDARKDEAHGDDLSR